MSIIARSMDYLANLDPRIFAVESQSSPADQKSFLSLQVFIRNQRDAYTYLEVGSHLGGTLLPHLLDPRCRHVVSVDLRPPRQPDERGTVYEYEDNSTARMLAGLAPHLPASAFLKLATFDMDASSVAPEQVGLPVDLALIDAEHTNVAAFRDFLAVRRFMADESVVAFHDAHLVCDALLNIEALLQSSGTPFVLLFLPDCVGAFVFGRLAPLARQVFGRVALDRDEFVERARLLRWRSVAANMAMAHGR